MPLQLLHIWSLSAFIMHILLYMSSKFTLHALCICSDVSISEFAASIYKLMYIQQASTFSRCTTRRHIFSPSHSATSIFYS